MIDPEQPEEILIGGGSIVVTASGDAYGLGSIPSTPAEMIGAILPPDDEEE